MQSQKVKTINQATTLFQQARDAGSRAETEIDSQKARQIDHTNIILQNKKEIEQQIDISLLFPTHVSHTVQLQNYWVGFIISSDPRLSPVDIPQPTGK
jgi:hypothetical protein